MNFIGAVNFLGLYFITSIFSLLFEAYGVMDSKRKKNYLICFFGFLAFIAAFRMDCVGNDTSSYVAHFTTIASYSNLFECIKQDGMEPGFVTYCWLLSRLNNNPQILLIVTSIIIYTSIGLFTYKYVKNVGLFCCLFLGIMQFDFFMSAMRQAIAVAIILYAFDFILKNKTIKFIIGGILATTFHYSSILFLLIYPFINKNKIKQNSTLNKMITFGIIIIIGFFFNKVISLILIIFPKYGYYMRAKTFDGVPRIALIMRILVYGLLFLVPKILYNKDNEYNKFNIIGSRLSYTNICILVIAMNAVALSRFSNTFSFFATMYFSNRVTTMNIYDRKIMILFTLMAFAMYGFIIILLKTPDWVTTYPIKLIF